MIIDYEFRIIGEHVFFAVLDDNDENWEVVEGDVYGIIADMEKKRTWIQYKIDTGDGPHVMSEDYVYSKKSEAEKRCQLLNKVKSS